MFESIHHSYTESGMSVALYLDGEVSGGVSFSSTEQATRVRSHIGPLEATRECLASHWAGYRGRYKARTEDEVQCYA